MRASPARRRLPASRHGAWLLWLLATGCDEAGNELQTIQGLRVLGARVESVADPSVAEPAAGDDTRLSWLVVSDRPTTFSARVRACAAVPTTTGLPHCSTTPFFEGDVEGDTLSDASVEFELPDLAANGEWLAALVVCGEGRARFREDGVGRCTGGVAPVEATYRARVGAEAPNRNPELSDDVLELKGRPWEPTAPEGTGEPCAQGSALPSLDRGVPHRVAFQLNGDDREPLPEEVRSHHAAPATESLLYSHFLTLPALERAFSAIDSESSERGFELELRLEPDVALPERGRVADFILVVRDDRGGADWLRRQACARR